MSAVSGLAPRGTPAYVLDVVAAVFGRLLRRHGVSASPAEVIEVRRVLGLVGAGDLRTLESALRATCAKYSYEQDGFDAAFDRLFHPRPVAVLDEHRPTRDSGADGAPTTLEISNDDKDTGRYADYNENAAEVGDFFDTPEADKGFNPHKDDDDLSITGADSNLAVDTENDSGRRGVSFTVDVDRADSATVGDLSSAQAMISQGTLTWDDPEGILRWLDAYDPHSLYGDQGDGEPLTAAQLEKLVDAVEAFVDAISGQDRAGTSRDTATASDSPDSDIPSRADVNDACREVLRRMRGTPRPRPREATNGRLNMRRTVRASMRTDGVPFHLMVDKPVPERVRLLVLADVSLSVRPITAFTLRLAQAMRHRTSRCTVLAFVDNPIDVTDLLARSTGDDALASVLAAPELDLEASSDYGRTLEELLTTHGSKVTSRTSVLIVGDGRCNGLPPRVDKLEELARKVHRLAWVTPEHERYWSQASCAMSEYAEVCNGVVTARDARQLIERAPDLGNALR
ncbi:VWA domain-containing protein [Rhodococcus sp. 06-156-3C]|uniref:MadC family VWA domain-containing protein n=1 Tax=Nocardiaceae TaxID=85025 RepID=UPI000522FD82|nr:MULTISPECIES: VWA domain-containing protein [Rhodococcus]OZD11269.1 VWA domain-containing protein [Rhodococcus sp. 06-156-3C]OZD13500.1 VWA domain-containing protein [Rhodococcus sp. 06-156-4a]OZD22159.1 VWA domain-containing protein [Rhodococcus sp. 06-156-4C]OZD30127.1 VWA domain-containing protein [Rhodococcus sp. 06-156-3]OZD37532.1 VWA domain-containing protein [Rhodococcus sp. 06-156-3b]